MIEIAAKTVLFILAFTAIACFLNMFVRQFLMIQLYHDETAAAEERGEAKGWHFLTSPAHQAGAARIFGDDRYKDRRRKLSQAWAWCFISFFLLFGWALVCAMTGIAPITSSSGGP